MRRFTALASLLAVAVGALALSTPARAADTVTLKGHVWGASLDGYSIVAHRGGGATVYIAERPELRTTAAEDGSWSLEVPDGEDITPCADLAGHHETCNQTYFTRGRDLSQVNFQMVDFQIATILGQFSGGELVPDENGNPRVKRCAIVSTFYEKEKRSFLDFQDFLDAAPHGVAGATAQATGKDGQTLQGPIYFNEMVLPDHSRTDSSRDGGVMWVEVPPGVYTITSSHPTDRFAPFQATCEDGRLVNASPPWGLYEMYGTEEPNPAVLPKDDPADEILDARVQSAKVVKKGKNRRLKVKVLAGEKVAVEVTARQGKAGATRKANLARNGTVTVKLGARFKGGSAKVNVKLRDQAGNRGSFAAVVSVPGKGRKKASIKDAKPTGAAPAPPQGTVTISGNAYAFIFAGDMRRLEGAVIKVVEYPELETIAGEQGAWSLEVPDNAKVTPYATFPDTTPEDSDDDYFTTYAQTFYTRGKDINRINFQMPKQWVVEALGAIVGADFDGPAGQKTLRNCAVVSTFFRLQRTKDGELIDGRTYTNFDDFHDYRAHGVADSTATLTDAQGNVPRNPIYFNASVIPDPSRTVSSGDGGVVWSNVPEGEYTVRGQHETKRFAEAKVTCAPGRLVNASPPWGLYEMAGNEESNPATNYEPPAPATDRRVDSRIGSARINNRKVILSVSTDSGEPASVVVNGRQGKRRFQAVRKLPSGKGLVKVKLPRKFRRGTVNVGVAINDEAGNKASFSAPLHSAR